MNYIEFETGKRVYKLRLNTRNTVLLEKLLGGNPLVVFTSYLAKDEIPPLETMVNILYASLKAYNEDITIDNTYDVFDEWLDDGHIIAEFINIIVDIYRQAGLIQKEKSEKN